MSGGALPGSVPGGPQQLSMNLPFPSPHGKASIVKLCDVKDGDIRLNDSIEVVEIVSLDPTLAAPEGDEENTSLVPRLNVLSFSNLAHNSPLLPSSGPFPPLQKVVNVELLSILTTFMLGDKHTAEYLLLHLISKVCLRKDVLVLGKLSLNLHNVTTHE